MISTVPLINFMHLMVPGCSNCSEMCARCNRRENTVEIWSTMIIVLTVD